MEMKKSSQCDCGKGEMILRKAGESSTRPGHYYYICPASVKHRRSFCWYLEYHEQNVTPTQEQSYKSENRATNLEAHSCYTSTPTFCKKESMNSSAGPYARRPKEFHPHASNQYSETDCGMSSTTYEIPNHGMKITHYSRDHVCCCFGFLCAFIIVLLVVITVLLFRF